MSSESAVLVPWGTLEANCLDLLLRSTGMRCVESPDESTTVVVMALPRRPGVLEQLVHETCDGLPVVVITDNVDATVVSLTRSMGSVTLLDWRSSGVEILSAIRRAAAGRPVRARTAAGRADPFSRLTEREREVMALVALGRTDQHIASTLGISAHTVHSHVRRTLAKLQVTHRHAAAALARTSAVMASHATVVDVSDQSPRPRWN